MGRRRTLILALVAIAGAVLTLRVPLHRVAAFTRAEAVAPGTGQARAQPTVPASVQGGAPAQDAAPARSHESAPIAVLAGRRIRGFLLDFHGTPVAGSLVEFRAAGDTEAASVTRAWSDAVGSFSIETGGRAGILFTRDLQLSTVFMGDTRAPDPQIPPVVVVAPSRPIEGEVVGEDGLALEGAEVSIDFDPDLRAIESRLGRSSRRSWTLWTQKDGRFSIPDAPATEDATLRVSRERHCAVELPLSSQPDVIRVELRRLPRGPAHIEGVVLDPAGAPIARARVSIGSWARISQDDGTFELNPPHPEETGATPEVLACAPGWLPAHSTAREGEVVIVMHERIPPIRGRVIDASGNPVAGAIVTSLDPPTVAEVSRIAGLANLDSEGGGLDPVGGFPTNADDRGRFEIVCVLPRGVTLRAHDPRTLASVKVGGALPGAEVELRIGGQQLVEVKGRVVDPRGLPIDGACIYLVRDQDGPRSIESSVQWTDAEGRFAWDAVDGEDLKIAVQVQSYAEPKHYPFKGSQSGEQTLVAGRAACVRVQVATAGLAADAFRILDPSGAVLWLGEGDGSRDALRRSASDELDLDAEAMTEPFWVSEDASTLLLLRGGTEVARMPIRVIPGEVTVLRL
jgi:protocatechuate 3,4-dioxygenase beta subunit